MWQKYIQNDAKGWAIDTDSSGNVYILSQNIKDVGAGSNDFILPNLMFWRFCVATYFWRTESRNTLTYL